MRYSGVVTGIIVPRVDLPRWTISRIPSPRTAERIESVSADDILRVARRVLVPENAVLSVVGPDLEEERLLGLLEG